MIAPADTENGTREHEALGHSGFIVLTLAFFVCGLQLVFITTHLPTYLDICGMDPSVTAGALSAARAEA